jgi:hypothetical protein
MTAEERDRMNALCLQIQLEKNYQKFEELTRELYDVVARKERRFHERKPLVVDPGGKGWKLMLAIAKRTLKPLYPQQAERVEISIADADELFREIRVENAFVDAEGNVLAIKAGAELDVRLETSAGNLINNARGHSDPTTSA